MRVKWLAAIAGGALLCAAGCTNSDVLTNGGATLRVNIVIHNGPSRFNDAFFYLRQIFVVPTDPISASVSGEPLALFNSRDVVEINANNEGLQFDVQTSLPVGTWRVDTVRIDSFYYDDFDPPASTATCQDFVARWVPNAQPIDVVGFGPDATFTLEPGVANQVNVVFEHPAFLSLFQASFTCFPQGVLGCTEAWCLYPSQDEPLFNPAPLSLAASQYLSFE